MMPSSSPWATVQPEPGQLPAAGAAPWAAPASYPTYPNEAGIGDQLQPKQPSPVMPQGPVGPSDLAFQQNPWEALQKIGNADG